MSNQAKQQRRVYTGPLDAIVTRLDGRERRVKRGDAVEVSDGQAKALDGHPHWQPAAPETPQQPKASDKPAKAGGKPEQGSER